MLDIHTKMNESCRREYTSLKRFALSSAKTMDTYLHNCWVAVVATYLYNPMCKRVTQILIKTCSIEILFLKWHIQVYHLRNVGEVENSI